MVTEAIDTTSDILDVRDIIERYEFLETGDDVDQDPESEDQRELALLASILQDLEGTGGDKEWRGHWYPVTLIRDSYFEDYAQELADDIGALNNRLTWPYNHIDWAAAAEELRIDYVSIDIAGQAYWYR